MAGDEHERGVAVAEAWAAAHGFELMPIEEVGGCRPDVLGKKIGDEGTIRLLIEVESCASLDKAQSEEQMKAFAKWAREISSRRLVLFAPRRCLEKARRALPQYSEYMGF